MAIILLTNDDGIRAEGLEVLNDFLLSLGHEVWIVAPEEERSGTSHSVTLKKPIYIKRFGPKKFAVSGNPADCVLIALYGILKEKPDIVISGINPGYNVGEDVFYSGTVAAAREGTMFGIPSLAVSIGYEKAERFFYENTFEFVKLLLPYLLKEKRGILFNLNVPNIPKEEIKGLLVTGLGSRTYVDPVEKIDDCKFIIGGIPRWFREEGTDIWALSNRYASVTPLKVNITDEDEMERLRRYL